MNKEHLKWFLIGFVVACLLWFCYLWAIEIIKNSIPCGGLHTYGLEGCY